MGGLAKILLLPFVLVVLPAFQPPDVQAATPQRASVALAVIVNPKNPTTNLTSAQLGSYLRLEQQFWSNKQRCKLFLRPSSSVEMAILLKHVYKMSSSELRRYWVGKVFRGEISAKPSVIPTAAAAGARVRKVVGAITVVRSSEVPAGVRVLSVDGKKPGESGYPLVSEKHPGDLP